MTRLDRHPTRPASRFLDGSPFGWLALAGVVAAVLPVILVGVVLRLAAEWVVERAAA